MDSSTIICWMSLFVILGVSGLFCHFFLFLTENPIGKQYSIDPDLTPHYVASDLGLHCLLMTLLPVSRLEWVNDPPIL